MAVVGRPLSVDDTDCVGGWQRGRVLGKGSGKHWGPDWGADWGRDWGPAWGPRWGPTWGPDWGKPSGAYFGIRPPSAVPRAQALAGDRASVPVTPRAVRPPNRECRRWASGPRSGRA